MSSKRIAFSSGLFLALTSVRSQDCTPTVLLQTNQPILEQGQTVATNGLVLEQEFDGGINLYKGVPGNLECLIWDSGMCEENIDPDVTFSSKLQGDGNLVTRRFEDGVSTVFWHAPFDFADEFDQNMFLIALCDGSVGVYRGQTPTATNEIWREDKGYGCLESSSTAAPIENPTPAPSPAPSPSPTASPPQACQRLVLLSDGESLTTATGFVQRDGAYMIQSPNGNFQVIEGTPLNSGRTIFESCSSNNPLNNMRTQLQADGNLVTTIVNSPNQVIWAANPDTVPDNRRPWSLVLECDGDAFGSIEITNSNGVVIWTSDTFQDCPTDEITPTCPSATLLLTADERVEDNIPLTKGQYTLIQETNGLFQIWSGTQNMLECVLFQNEETTSPSVSAYTALQRDGNLVTYVRRTEGAAGEDIWDTGTAQGQSNEVFFLVVDNCNFSTLTAAIYTQDPRFTVAGRPLWTTPLVCSSIATPAPSPEPTPAPTPAPSSSCQRLVLLNEGESVATSTGPVQRNGAYMVQSSNGNFRVIEGTPTNSGRVIFESCDRFNAITNKRTELQFDGNLVTRDARTGEVVWAANPPSVPDDRRPWTLALECDGESYGSITISNNNGITIWEEDTFEECSNPSLPPTCRSATILLETGERVNDESLLTKGSYTLRQDTNGNFQIWQGPQNSLECILWETDVTTTPSVNAYTALQNDGNLVSYIQRTSGGNVIDIFNTETSTGITSSDYVLVVDNCNFSELTAAIYTSNPRTTVTGDPLWTTSLACVPTPSPTPIPTIAPGPTPAPENQCPTATLLLESGETIEDNTLITRGSYTMAQLTDGMFQIWRGTATELDCVLFETGATANPIVDAFTILQTDGNLVTYFRPTFDNAIVFPLWSSSTEQANIQTYFLVVDNCNFGGREVAVIYGSDPRIGDPGQPLWTENLACSTPRPTAAPVDSPVAPTVAPVSPTPAPSPSPTNAPSTTPPVGTPESLPTVSPAQTPTRAPKSKSKTKTTDGDERRRGRILYGEENVKGRGHSYRGRYNVRRRADN